MASGGDEGAPPESPPPAEAFDEPDDAAREQFVALLEQLDGTWRQRKKALEEIGRLGPQALPLAEDVLDIAVADEDFDVKLAARRALVKLGPGVAGLATVFLAERLAEDDHQSQGAERVVAAEQAARTVRELATDEEVSEQMVQIAVDLIPMANWRLGEAIGKVVRRYASAACCNGDRCCSVRLRRDAARRRELARDVVRRSLQGAAQVVRDLCAHHICWAAGCLIEYLRDDERESVREAAACALGCLAFNAPPEVKPALELAKEKDSSFFVREAALKGYQRVSLVLEMHVRCNVVQAMPGKI